MDGGSWKHRMLMAGDDHGLYSYRGLGLRKLPRYDCLIECDSTR